VKKSNRWIWAIAGYNQVQRLIWMKRMYPENERLLPDRVGEDVSC